MPLRRSRETTIRSLSLAVGVSGSLSAELVRPKKKWELPSRACSSSDPDDGCRVGDREDEIGESTKPIPGVRDVLGPMGGRVGSALSRQERARTPIKRMTVPRAI